MSRYHGNGDQCPGCGLKYGDFRCSTVTSFQEAKDALYSASSDPADWRYRRKHTVLGFWFMTKQAEWKAHIADCTGEPVILEAFELEAY